MYAELSIEFTLHNDNYYLKCIEFHSKVSSDLILSSMIAYFQEIFLFCALYFRSIDLAPACFSWISLMREACAIYLLLGDICANHEYSICAYRNHNMNILDIYSAEYHMFCFIVSCGNASENYGLILRLMHVSCM